MPVLYSLLSGFGRFTLMLEKSSKQFISLAPRTKRVRHEETWWKAVQSIAALFRKQHDGKELSEPAIKQHLVERWTPFDFTVEMWAAASFQESQAVHGLQFVRK